ncbi:MAG: helix-turn-helix domain-containing protein [Planktothrix sp.]
MSTITFGKLLGDSRRNLGLSQKEFTQLLQQHSVNIDYQHLSKIENNRLDIKAPIYDDLIDAVAEILELNIDELKQIRSTTEIEQLDLSGAIFPVCYKD